MEREHEKNKILEMMKYASQSEVKYTKEQNFHRAISFSIDEIKELEEHYRKFVQSVSHLVLYQEAVKNTLDKDVEKLFTSLRYLIEKNYSSENQERMPENVLRQVKATQTRRYELLMKVAKQYFHK